MWAQATLVLLSHGPLPLKCTTGWRQTRPVQIYTIVAVSQGKCYLRICGRQLLDITAPRTLLPMTLSFFFVSSSFAFFSPMSTWRTPVFAFWIFTGREPMYLPLLAFQAVQTSQMMKVDICKVNKIYSSLRKGKLAERTRKTLYSPAMKSSGSE